ncbi:MAG: hypothetical protein JWO42_470 [Chloroflexi bacterium]|nr:hypothetical protein [Chloroflexota bacterium]
MARQARTIPQLGGSERRARCGTVSASMAQNSLEIRIESKIQIRATREVAAASVRDPRCTDIIDL